MTANLSVFSLTFLLLLALKLTYCQEMPWVWVFMPWIVAAVFAVLVILMFFVFAIFLDW